MLIKLDVSSRHWFQIIESILSTIICQFQAISKALILRDLRKQQKKISLIES